MRSNDDYDIKCEMATVEERLYAFKDKVEEMVRRQIELERRLHDAELCVMENAELQRKYDELLTENFKLKTQLMQLNNSTDSSTTSVST
uniref:Protein MICRORCHIDIA 6 n=1 Tax=Syphacia muris TaxID=451379 RepID=A0A158R4V5_9BILA